MIPLNAKYARGRAYFAFIAYSHPGQHRSSAVLISCLPVADKMLSGYSAWLHDRIDSDKWPTDHMSFFPN